MILHPPFKLGSRLLPALKIGEAEISLQYDGYTAEGRVRYRYYIDGVGPGYTNNDICSGGQGGFLDEGFASLLSFLCACAEAGDIHRRTGQSCGSIDLFPGFVREWAMQNADEIATLAIELGESDTLIEA